MSEVRKIKPSLSKGTRDFLPAEVARRNYIFDTIKSVFRKYGFEQIETPGIERLETLTGKYGEEGDKLLFKILESGNYLEKAKNIFYEFHKELNVQNPTIQSGDKEQSILYPFSEKPLLPYLNEFTKKVAEKGLRYDLTVPLARYVVQHQDELAFPFKRFHIGPVWRADRPQKGRYQEFYQCDADVIGSTSLLNEVELTKIYLEVFEKLGIKVTIRINNRKLLEGLGEIFKGKVSESLKAEGDQDRIATLIGYATISLITAIDKIDKIGVEGAKNELLSKGFPKEAVKELDEMIKNFKSIFKSSGTEQELRLQELMTDGVREIDFVLGLVNNENVKLDSLLARGLTYYTGIIWEVVCADKNVQMGSIASGGRYDNLTEMFGGQNMSGVGISFGIERIYDVMEELNLFPETISQGVKVLFVPRDASAEEFTFEQTQALRDAGIGAEIFLGNVKKQKQFNYAEQKNIAYIVEVGGDEISSKKFRLRNAKTRETTNDLWLQNIIEILQKG